MLFTPGPAFPLFGHVYFVIFENNENSKSIDLFIAHHAHIISLFSSDFAFSRACVHRERERYINMATRQNNTLQNDEKTLKTTKIERRRMFTAFRDHFPAFREFFL